VRLPREAMIVVRRGGEVLVVHRSPEGGGYWHQIAGGVEQGETDAEAARRELEEETGLAADPGALRHAYAYALAEEPERRGAYPPGTESIAVACFLVDVPPGWEPRLDHEHDDHRWCTIAEARALLRWADAADAVEKLASQYA
jgi:8-oxo-dGTP pyrophosphatase MutT (NUDIX family)